MKLNLSALESRRQWEEQGFALPSYNVADVRRRTRAQPTWVHFGAGNIFRMFVARIQDELLDRGLADTGVIIGETRHADKLDVTYAPYDNLTTAVTLRADGTIAPRVIGCIAETLKIEEDHPDWRRAEDIFAAPSLQMLSLTITEKGYLLTDHLGRLSDRVKAEFADPELPSSNAMGKICKLLYARFRAGAAPITLVSLDNVAHNGTLFRESVLAYGKAWTDAGFLPQEFYAYLVDPALVSFPWTMIDKITPAASPAVGELLEARGYEDTARPERDGRRLPPSYANAEATEYLVIEDSFTNGRPPWDKAGVIFADRETVDRVETMKVTTCLNPLHTALAVFGCLLGYDTIGEEMQDPDLVNLLRGIGYAEGLPVVVDPGILHPRDFLDTVMTERLPNPFLADRPQRIATDTSQKLAVRYGETLKAYQEEYPAKVRDLEFIPAVLAGWLRYLMGRDDQGAPMELSPDPLMDELQAYFEDLSFGDNRRANELLIPLLRNDSLFGLNLVATGLSDKIIADFKHMNERPFAVREFLQKLPCV